MSSINDKLALLPKRIPVTFQFGAGPTVTGTLILTNPYLKCLEIESDGKIRHIEHFINSYARHNDVKYLHFKTTEQVFLSFVVASGERTGKSFQTLLVDEPIPNDWLPFVGIVDPTIAKVQGMLDQVHATEDKDVKAPIVIELMRYFVTAIPFIRRYPPLHAVAIAKCEEFRKDHHGEFPEVVAACTDLLVALGQTPAPLISGDELVLKQWTARLPRGVVVSLQISTGPRIEGILYPHSNTVLSTFYYPPIHLQKWVSKYCKTYGLGKRTLSVIEIIRYLRIGDHNLYTLLENWKPSYSSFVTQALDSDMARIRGIPLKEPEVDEEESDAGPCDCAGCTPEETSCDCRSCEQEKRVDDLFHRTDKLFCAFLAYDDADYCKCVRCVYEETLNKRIRELEGQMNIVLKRLNLQEEKKEDDEW
jgi:hypothetical protein